MTSKKSAPLEPAAPLPAPKATATIDPAGRRDAQPREHVIKLVLELVDEQLERRAEAGALARRCLSAFAPEAGDKDRRVYRDQSITRRGKNGAPIDVVVAIEGVAVSPGRPSDAAIEAVRAELAAAGFRVSLRERRECTQPSCSTDALVDWRRGDERPPSWFSATICGRHDLRTCPGCRSVFRLSSDNAVGQSPSLHCEVCGNILVEWGGSKLWTAELVERRDPAA